MRILQVRSFVLTSFLVFAPTLCAQKTDVVVMKNGDHLTCEVVGLTGGVLNVKLDYVDGTLSVQWSQVARVETKRLLIVKTTDGSVYSGRISTAEPSADNQVRIQVGETQEKPTVIESSKIVNMDSTSEKFLRRFNGDVSLGLIYSKGNQSTQYNLSSTVEYPRERWSAEGDFDSTLSKSTGSNASTRNQFFFSTQRLLRWKNYFYSGVGGFLTSSEQGIRLQTGLGAGIGRYFKNTNRSRISLLGGLAWQRTRYDDSSLSTQNSAAGMVGLDVRAFKFKKTNFRMTAALLPSISEPGRVYFRTNESYYIKLFSNLSWNFTFYGNWDNRPPHGLAVSDYGSSSGLSWTFGNR